MEGPAAEPAAEPLRERGRPAERLRLPAERWTGRRELRAILIAGGRPAAEAAGGEAAVRNEHADLLC